MGPAFYDCVYRYFRHSRRELYVMAMAMATNTTRTQDAQRKMLYNNRPKPAGHCNMNSFTIQCISIYIETSQILFILYQMELTKPNQIKPTHSNGQSTMRTTEREKTRERQASCTRDPLHSFPVLIEDRDSIVVERDGIAQQKLKCNVFIIFLFAIHFFPLLNNIPLNVPCYFVSVWFRLLLHACVRLYICMCTVYVYLYVCACA